MQSLLPDTIDPRMGTISIEKYVPPAERVQEALFPQPNKDVRPWDQLALLQLQSFLQTRR